mgnify:CR=1 FL=1|tara:strand:+ start:307 stop:645 length:339 start_codon:yes stop_codon:yes gene_type:complete
MSKKQSIVGVKVIRGDINRALKKLKRKVNDSAHLLEIRERRYYTKPTTVRRRQKQLAVREQQKETILGKIDDGDTTLRFYTKKKKPQLHAKKNDNTDKPDKTVESYGLRMQK